MDAPPPEAVVDDRGRSLAWWTPIGVVIAHCAFGPLRSDSPPGPSIDNLGEVVSCLLIGVSLGQPILCAAWAALAAGLFLRRFLSALLAVAALASTNVIDNPTVTFAAFGLLFVVHWSVMAYLRARFGWRLAIATNAAVEGSDRQFSVRTLLAWTTGCAVLSALLRWVAEVSDLPPLPQFASVVLGFGFALAPALLALNLILSTRRPSLRSTFIDAIMTAGLVFTGYVIVFVSEPPSLVLFETLALFSLGAILDAALCAYALRLAGYRLVSGATANHGE